MSRLRTPFGLAVLGLLVLAGWASWSAGIFDGPLAREVRVNSIYTAPGFELDHEAAERIIGNRRLVVAFMAPGTDLGDACDDTEGAAESTIVLLLARDGDDWDRYGCSDFPGGDDENFGKAVVAETTIASGTDQFVDQPLEALKVVAVNYDGLVKAGVVPDGARTISPSLPRYLIAGAAVVGVLGGAVALFVGSRRVGRLAAAHREERDAATDVRGSLNARAAVLASKIIELDRRYPKADRTFQTKYRKLAADYTELVEDLTAEDVDPDLGRRVDALTDRAGDLTRTAAPGGSSRR
jgi:hypothetical protein